MQHSDFMYGKDVGSSCAKIYVLARNKLDYLHVIEKTTEIDLKIAAACWEAIDQYEGEYRQD